MSFDLTCSQSSSLIAQNSVETQILNMENTIASTGSRCEQALGHQLSGLMLTNQPLIVQNSHAKIKFYKQKTTAGTGSGCEQALGHEL
jgi:hypothetical protein